MERLTTLLYNAICMLAEYYEHDELLEELGMTDEEYSHIVE